MNGPRWKQRVLAADRWLRTRPMGVQIGVCYLMFMAVAFVFGLVKLAID